MPFVGADALSLGISLDKIMAKKIFMAEGIPTPRFMELKSIDGLDHLDHLKFPLFVKPVAQGSSVGITKVKKASGLRRAVDYAFRFDTAVMIEKGVDRAREIVCGVLGSASGAAASVTGEVVPKGSHEFYDYEAKYAPGGSIHTLPAKIPPAVAAEAMRLSELAHAALGCRGVSRTDFRYDDTEGKQRLIVLETNTQPGMTPTNGAQTDYRYSFFQCHIENPPSTTRLCPVT